MSNEKPPREFKRGIGRSPELSHRPHDLTDTVREVRKRSIAQQSLKPMTGWITVVDPSGLSSLAPTALDPSDPGSEAGGITPVMQSPWVNVGDPFPPLRFFLSSEDGVLLIEGAIMGGNPGDQVCLLPMTMRPDSSHVLICPSTDGSSPHTFRLDPDGILTYLGIAADVGATGAAGATGAGVTGATGSQGATGPPGATGATGSGATGATGSQGATGSPGGATGATGAAGAAGATGAQGATGATGAGVTGATGPAGATGATGPGIVSEHSVQAKRSTAWTHNSTGNWLAIPMDAENFDTDAYHDNSTNNSRLTVPAGLAGRYVVTAEMSWDGNTTGRRHMAIRVNGVEPAAAAEGGNNDNGNAEMSLAVIIDLAVGDYVEAWAFQNSGANRTTNESAVITTIGMHLITGVAGATGSAGATGATGTAGSAGATGATGVGATGATGTQGATGTPGLDGLDGSVGASGATGATGIGATGATGSQGATGNTGAQGTTGATGAQGNTGATGPTGTAGTQGSTGATGPAGLDGLDGGPGAAGATGATGVGATGATGVGATGATGTAGAAGATGAAGIDGIDGGMGATGPSAALGYVDLVKGDGATSYWRFEEEAIGFAKNEVGTARGVYTGNFIISEPGILNGLSVLLDGATSTYVLTETLPAFPNGDIFTLEAWIKRGSINGPGSGPVSPTEGQQIVFWAGTNGFSFGFTQTNKLFFDKGNVSTIVTSTRAITDTEQWHHVVVTKNGSTSCNLYLDGVDVSGTVTNATIVDNIGPIYIGSGGGLNSFKGKIDEVAIYPTALTAAQVLEHWETGSAQLSVDGPDTFLSKQTRADDTIQNSIIWVDEVIDGNYEVNSGVEIEIGTNRTLEVLGQQRGGWGLPSPLVIDNTITPAQVTADQNDWNPGTSTDGVAFTAPRIGHTVVCVSSDAARSITGMLGGYHGRMVLLVNIGGFTISLTHDQTSTAANRFYIGQGAIAGNNFRLGQNNSVWLWYDGAVSRWRVIENVAVGGATPLALGTATSGTSLWASREDHVHPSEGVWQGYTPTLTQSGAVTKTVTSARYCQIGKLVHVLFELAVTGAGTTANAIRVGLPVTAASGASYIGSGSITDVSVQEYPVLWLQATTTTLEAYRTDTAVDGPLGVSPAFALANTDSISGYVMYEAA